MLFAIFYKSSDLCGNTDRYFVGYYEAESREEARKHFPPGAFTGFGIDTIKPKTKSELYAIIDENTKEGTLRNWR